MQSCVFVISNNGKRLMPTKHFGKVRRMINSGRATIFCHKPFTIQLTYDTVEYTQPIEFCQDTGYLHIGNSIKSASHEYISEELITLKDEKHHHDDQRRYRKNRRSRKRYRAPRFDNRKRNKGSIAPSLRHKADIHLEEIAKYIRVCPITSIIVEVGQFDTARIKAIERDEQIPVGMDYQRGDRYEKSTLREAVFQRDGYKCVICKRGISENAILHVHHALYWDNRHGNQLDELITVCEKCHTPANHKKGGKLYGYTPNKKLITLADGAFMNSIRWSLYEELHKKYPNISTSFTYGAITKVKRADLQLPKSHCNDAFAMGKYHPYDRAFQNIFQKVRRNNRVLQRFCDAKIIDIRDKSVKNGGQLGCERINRSQQRRSPQSLRQYRGATVSKGKTYIRRKHYSIRPGDIVLFKNNPIAVIGVQSNGTQIKLKNGKSTSIKNVMLLKHTGGWLSLSTQQVRK